LRILPEPDSSEIAGRSSVPPFTVAEYRERIGRVKQRMEQ
jgi:hypothetical protein